MAVTHCFVRQLGAREDWQAGACPHQRANRGTREGEGGRHSTGSSSAQVHQAGHCVRPGSLAYTLTVSKCSYRSTHSIFARHPAPMARTAALGSLLLLLAISADASITLEHSLDGGKTFTKTGVIEVRVAVSALLRPLHGCCRGCVAY